MNTLQVNSSVKEYSTLTLLSHRPISKDNSLYLLLFFFAGSGYPYLSAYMSGGGSPGAYKPPGSSQPSPASLAAATTGLHMPHYWPSSAETSSRGTWPFVDRP